MINKEEATKITLEDFPDDIYILLEDDFRAKFFKTAWKINKSYRHLAKKLGVSNPVMLSWRRGRINFTKKDQYCPIWAIKEIINKSQDSPEWGHDLGDVQKHIKSIRSKAGSYKIYNVKLPISDSVELRELVTHLICDGSALNEKRRTSKYASTSLETVKKFKQNLAIFGTIPNMEIKERVYDNHYLKCYILSFSKAITKILSHKFKVDFRSAKARLPKDFFSGNKKLLIAVVRTFFIDEGCINDRTIYFCSGSLNLLEDLKIVCNNLGYQCQNIRKSNTAYYLIISPNSFEKFYEDIISLGPLPIKEKQGRLILGINILKNKPDFKNLSQSILEILNKNPSTKLELSKELLVNAKTIGERLLKLEKDNMVIRLDRVNGKGGYQKWHINS